jgi:hypothetical protein
MAKDADGNYYYDEGTINEQFDDVKVVEDSDGNLSIVVSGNEMRVENLSHVFGGGRADPVGGDLAAGEAMLYVDDSTPAQFKVAYATDDSTVVVNALDSDLTV